MGTKMLNNYKISCTTKKLVIVSIINQIIMIQNKLFFADFLKFYSSGYTVIVLSNATNGNAEDMARNIARIL